MVHRWTFNGINICITKTKIQLYTFLGITAVISIVPIVYSYLEFKIKNQ